MDMDIPEELKIKLKMIEKEKDFFGRRPREPGRLSGFIGTVVVLLFLVVQETITKGFLSPLALLCYFGLMLIIAEYWYSKKLFRTYLLACEIIDYYKSKE